MKRFIVGGLVVIASLLFAAPALATGDEEPKVTICHVAGLASDPANYITLTIGYSAVYGPAGHFYENGTPQAGHEQDTLGECNPPPPPTDVCPNIDGVQATVPEGYTLVDGMCIPDTPPLVQVTAAATFSEATCTSGPRFNFSRTIPGLRFYNVIGLLLDGGPVAGMTYTITAAPDEGYTVVGQSVFTHTFAAAPTNCNPPPPHVVTGAASTYCDLGSQTYILSGTIDGMPANSVSPATLPGSTRGTTNVTVTRGDTSFRTSVTTNGDCPTTTTTTTPPPVTTTTTTTPATTPAKPAAAKPKPVAKPKPKAKPKAKPKPTVKKPKAAKPFKQPDGCPNGKVKYKGKCVTGVGGNG